MEKEKIKFSVLMPVYNKENPIFLKQALESIIQQTLMPNEIVIVKDGALTKELDNIINNYSSNYNDLFNIITLVQNIGPGRARNAGLQACKYNYIALMDSDDIADLTRFEKQIGYLEKHPEIDCIGSNITEFEENPENIISKKVVPLKQEEIFKFGKWRSPMNNVTIIYKKDKVLEVGGYNSFNFGEDYLLFAKMLVAGMKFHNLEEWLVNARGGASMLSKRIGFCRIIQEFKLFWTFYKMKYINIFEFSRNVSLKFLLRIIPTWFRSWIYQTFLRTKVC